MIINLVKYKNMHFVKDTTIRFRANFLFIKWPKSQNTSIFIVFFSKEKQLVVFFPREKQCVRVAMHSCITFFPLSPERFDIYL